MPVGGEGGEGGGKDRWAECLGDLTKAFLALLNADSPCLPTILCQSLANCLATAIMAPSVEGMVQGCKVFFAEPPMMFGCACLIGAGVGFIHNFIDHMCEKLGCESHAEPWCSALVNGLAGCATGIAGIINVNPWISSFFIGGIEGGLEQGCDRLGR